jgi:putative oxygen-independent coproporphyrinogen III oxidase
MTRKLAIYVHWPYCAAICPYCDFNVYKAAGRDSAPLVGAILNDLAGWRAQTGPREVSSIFFGGGTPSLMEPAQVGAIIDAIARLWGLSDGVEIALEANPTDAEACKFEDLAQVGIERLSLGLQSLDDASLKSLGRFHSSDEGRRAATLARRLFPRLSIDLIYARPAQTLAEWQAELSDALNLQADHVSPYQLTIESGTAFERAVTRGNMVMPNNDLAADFYTLTQDLLEDAGFEAYEVSNHAKGRANRSRHNEIYWQSGDWLGVGPGAHGRIGWVEAGRRATKAAMRPEAYIALLAQHGHGLIEDDVLPLGAVRDEFWLMGLRMKDGVRRADAPGPPLVEVQVAGFVKAGLVWETPDLIGLTPAGRMVSDSVIGKLLGCS